MSSRNNLAVPFTPELLADRRDCSAEKFLQMFHRGELAGFRLGSVALCLFAASLLSEV